MQKITFNDIYIQVILSKELVSWTMLLGFDLYGQIQIESVTNSFNVFPVCVNCENTSNERINIEGKSIV